MPRGALVPHGWALRQPHPLARGAVTPAGTAGPCAPLPQDPARTAGCEPSEWDTRGPTAAAPCPGSEEVRIHPDLPRDAQPEPPSSGAEEQLHGGPSGFARPRQNAALVCRLVLAQCSALRTLLRTQTMPVAPSGCPESQSLWPQRLREKLQLHGKQELLHPGSAVHLHGAFWGQEYCKGG